MKRVAYGRLFEEHDGVCTYAGLPFTGIAYELRRAGVILTESEFVNGLRDGVVRSWYDSGQLEFEAGYSRGKLHGTFRQWDENGALSHESLFECGVCMNASVRRG